jgi:hypothetical protein
MQRIAPFAAVLAVLSCGVAHAQERKTNIVVIWGDDEQRAEGTLRIWAEPFTPLRFPKVFNLRTDPYYVGGFLQTFKDYPQRQKAETFNLDEVLKKLQESGGSK